LVSANAAIVTSTTCEKKVGHNAIAWSKMRDLTPHLGYYARWLVAQDMRQWRNIAKPHQNVQVCTADTATASLDKDLLRANLRHRNIFNPERLAHLMHHCSFH
jgi:hypothetical protein